MPSFCDGIRHTILRDLNNVSNEIKVGINSWLASGKDYIVTRDLTNNCFVIESYISEYLKPYAFDINRLSCASIESINDIDLNSSPKFLGWIITKYYYSAFFSAHAILRLTGNAILNIDIDSIQSVKKTTHNYGFTYATLNTGLYCNVLNTTNSIEFSKDPQYDDSHKGLWLRFLHYINNISSGIYAQLPVGDAQIVVDKLSELKDALTNWGSNTGLWLSRIRNLTNYSQEFGLWFPYSNYKKEFDNIIKYKNLCKSSPLEIDLATYRGKDLLYFVRTCQLINAINFEVQKDLLDRHPANKSFLSHGIFEYHSKYIKSKAGKLDLI